MDALRRSWHAVDPPGPADSFGWLPGNPAQHCLWDLVACDADGHVQALTVGSGQSPMGAAAGAALPDAGSAGAGGSAAGWRLPAARAGACTGSFCLLADQQQSG